LVHSSPSVNAGIQDSGRPGLIGKSARPINIRNPLSEMVEDFRFYLLKNCGHRPWYEKLAKDKFFELLRSELE